MNPDTGLCEPCTHRDPHPYDARQGGDEWVLAEFPYCDSFDAYYECLPCE